MVPNDSTQRLEKILSCFPKAKVGFLGDFCVDAYWDLRGQGEPSLETGLCPNLVSGARYSPGGGGNVLANLAEAGNRSVLPYGCVGNEPFGLWLQMAVGRLLSERKGSRGAFPLACVEKNYDTPVYVKPMCNGVEQPRYDIAGDREPPLEAQRKLVAKIVDDIRGNKIKVLVINQQFLHGVNTSFLRKSLAPFIGTIPFLYDGRDIPDGYPGSILKLNAPAASRLAFGEEGRDAVESAAALREGRPGVVVTDGERGCVVASADGLFSLPAIACRTQIDIVGAGDAFFATFSLAIAVGATLQDAAALGTCAASVTIRKIGQTGTASPDEIRKMIPRLGTWKQCHLK
ncbi:MAG: hypothetical protein IJJ26_10740 [Victivallales bacterium]|nr:hypothetical protein [Victivallales bacterium]